MPLTAPRWNDRTPAVPPPSRRGRGRRADTDEGAAVALLRDIEDVLAVLGHRSPADFRPLPFLVTERLDVLQQAFDHQDPLPPALVVVLAPLLTPRLERLAPRLRRRLSRKRKLLPLNRIREMDPASVQRNSRLPGRSLIQKAGPRQRLHGVVRVPRFDTTENRVLVAASQRLEREAAQLLSHLPPRRRLTTGGRAKQLRHLLVASRAVLARPELEGVGHPRPGERPSNAMLGDADYRAAWRAWQLLCREEARFADEWRALHQAWAELLLLAAWAALDRRPDLEPVAGWARVRHARQDGRRVEVGGPRQWIQWRPEGPALVSVDLDQHGVALTTQRAGAAAEAVTLPTDLFVGTATAPAGGTALAHSAASRVGAEGLARDLVAAVPLGQLLPQASALPGGDRVGMSLLDARGRASVDGQPHDLGPTAAAWLTPPDEAPLVATGRPATWLAEVAGPDQLHRAAAVLAGHLVHAHQGAQDTALVVPDAMSLLARSDLRRTAGPIWLVPAPVAAALAVGDSLDGTSADAFGVLCVVQTDASLDVAVLERRMDVDQPTELVWVRSAPSHDSSGGTEARLDLADPGSHGAWLRTPDATHGWALRDGGLRPTTPQSEPSQVAAVAAKVLDRWRGAQVRAVLAFNIDDVPATALAELVGGPIRRLGPETLATGAERFLVRQHAGLPTWADRLPRLDLTVRVDRLRTAVPLVAPDTLVAPGDLIEHQPDQRFWIPPAQHSIDFPMELEGRPDPAVLRLNGHPLPLERPAQVQVRVRYVHGREGLSVSLIPTDGAAFQRLDFSLAAAGAVRTRDTGDNEAQAMVEHQQPPAPLAEDLQGLWDAHHDLKRLWSGLSARDRKQALKQVGVIGPGLQSALKRMTAAAACVRASGPGTLPPAVRRQLEEGPAAWLDWLLGLGRLKKAGRAPRLSKDETHEAVRARATLRVRGTSTVAQALVDGALKIPPTIRLDTLGLLVDGHDDAVTHALIGAQRDSLAEDGAWALGLAHALDGHPALGAALSEEQVVDILDQAVAAVDRITRSPGETPRRYRRSIFRLLLLPPRLCRLRVQGHLPIDSPAVRTAVAALVACRALLPEDVRRFAGSRAFTSGDEPIAVAIDHLNGLTGVIPSTEDA